MIFFLCCQLITSLVCFAHQNERTNASPETKFHFNCSLIVVLLGKSSERKNYESTNLLKFIQEKTLKEIGRKKTTKLNLIFCGYAENLILKKTASQGKPVSTASSTPLALVSCCRKTIISAPQSNKSCLTEKKLSQPLINAPRYHVSQQINTK